MSNSAWFVIYVSQGTALKFGEELKKAGLVAYVPLAVKFTRKRGHKRLSKIVKPAFGNYVFVELSKNDPEWHIVRNREEYVRTISDFSGPIEVKEEVVGNIMLAEAWGRLDLDKDDWGLIFDRELDVVVANGPYAGRKGIVQKPKKDGEELVRVAIGNVERNLRVDFIMEVEDIPRPDKLSGP